MKMEQNQITNTILMVRPANFGFNEQTAESNAFQREAQYLSPEEVQQQAVVEFDQLVATLREAGIEVLVFEDTPNPVKTDAVFPNNWMTTHESGQVCLYPMLSPTRRLERRMDIVQGLQNLFEVCEVLHFEDFEDKNWFLEGTGSMILDREHRLVYACRSDRTNPELLRLFCSRMNYELVLFTSEDRDGKEIYHTNVMMALGTTFVVICLESIQDEQEIATLKTNFEETNKSIIEISMDQVYAFAGNMLHVGHQEDAHYLVMSGSAFESLTPDQIEQIQEHTEIVSSPIPAIEQLGGGSVRCMIAEIFLEKKMQPHEA